MSSPLLSIEAEAMKLSAPERADLADRLWHSAHTPDEVEQAWQAEIERRAQQVDAGSVTCRPWAEVMANLKAAAV